MDDFKSKLVVEQEKYTKLVDESRQQKEKYEKQLADLKTNFVQVKSMLISTLIYLSISSFPNRNKPSIVNVKNTKNKS